VLSNLKQIFSLILLTTSLPRGPWLDEEFIQP
jgi:hypothetical protein